MKLNQQTNIRQNEKIKKIREIKKDRGTQKPLVRIQTIYSTIEHDPQEFFDFWESQSHTANIPPILSDGCPHSAASQVSLKSNHLIKIPILKAACIGSNMKLVPGTLEPEGTEVPHTTGPNIFLQASYSRASSPHPSESIRHKVADFSEESLNLFFLTT